VNELLLAATDQHTNGPLTGVGGLVVVGFIIWLLCSGGGKKK